MIFKSPFRPRNPQIITDPMSTESSMSPNRILTYRRITNDNNSAQLTFRTAHLSPKAINDKNVYLRRLLSNITKKYAQ